MLPLLILASAPDLLFRAYTDEALPTVALPMHGEALRPYLDLPGGVPVPNDGIGMVRIALPDQRLGGVAIGDRWDLVGPEGRTSCAVASFGVVREESPRSDLKLPDYAAAPCEAPMPYAALRCEGAADKGPIAVPAANQALRWATPDPTREPTPLADDAPELARFRAKAQELFATAHQGDVDLDRPLDPADALESSSGAYAARLGDHTLVIYRGAYVAGRGIRTCAQDAVNVGWAGVSVDGAPPVMFWHEEGDRLEVIDLEGDGAPELLVWGFDRVVRLSTLAGKEITRFAHHYCECGC